MTATQSLNTFAFDQIRLALTGLIGLTGAHLGVVILTRTIYKRARQQLAGLEALLRRLLLLMAFEMEHKIKPDMRETTGILRPRDQHLRVKSWSAFQPCRSGYLPDFAAMPQRNPHWQQPLVRPILARINLLQAVLEDPEAHARRMAYRLARQRDDQYPALPYTDVNMRRLGIELSTLYPLIGGSINKASRTRPPRAGPRPRPPPRISQL